MLTYHHFDPTWQEGHIHSPEGMIALCQKHHSMADGGMWTNAQLKEMKANPYVNDKIRVQWPYQPETLVMKVGRSLIIGSGSPFRLNERPILKFRPKMIESLCTRTVVFDADIRDNKGAQWLSINDNWLDIHLPATTKVDFPPQAKTLTVKHKDSSYISLRYKKIPFNGIEEWLNGFITKPEMVKTAPKSIELAGAIDSDGMVPIMFINGHFSTREIAVTVKGDRMLCECFIPGLQETFECHSWIVDDIHRVSMINQKNNKEFFSLG